MQIQTQNQKAKPSRVTKKANGEYNVKYTSYRYTQPRYMNGMMAPAMISAFPAQFILNYLNSIHIRHLVALAFLGYLFASVFFALSYIIVVRPSLLDGGMRLAYHRNPVRALPLGFIMWIGVWMFILDFGNIFYFLKESYLNDIISVIIPFILFLGVYYVLDWFTLMLGDHSVSDIGKVVARKVSSFVEVSQTSPYKLTEIDIRRTTPRETATPKPQTETKTAFKATEPKASKPTPKPAPKKEYDSPGVVHKKPR